MADYVQCPNCGGYKVNLLETITETYKQKEKYRAYGCFSWFAGALGFILVMATCLTITSVIDAILSLFINGNLSTNIVICSSLAIIPSALLAIPVAIFMGKRDRKKSLEREQKGELVEVSRERVVGYKYYCNICGHRWRWDVGTQLPTVTVRPDLIKKVESQRWYCVACGNSNDGTRTTCYVCGYPKP